MRGATLMTFNIYQDGAKIHEGVAELTKVITDLSPATEYTFEVTKVEDGVESDKSTALKVTTKEATPEVVLVESITPSQKTMTLEHDGSKALSFTVAPEGATNKELDVTNSNPEFATYEGGTVTAVAEGSTTITATAKDGSGVKATCVVTVKAAPAPAPKQPKSVRAFNKTTDSVEVSFEKGE